MKVVYFGTYERDYPRNAQVISCLRRAGVEVMDLEAGNRTQRLRELTADAPEVIARGRIVGPQQLCRPRRAARLGDAVCFLEHAGRETVHFDQQHGARGRRRESGPEIARHRGQAFTVD